MEINAHESFRQNFYENDMIKVFGGVREKERVSILCKRSLCSYGRD